MNETDDRESPPHSPRIVERTISDIVEVGEYVAAIVRDDEGIKGFRDSHSSGQSRVADRHDDGSVSFEIGGTSRQGEDGNVGVCEILVNRLNLDGGNWSKPVDVSKKGAAAEQGVDCESYDGADTLKMQVTRVDHDVWRLLNSRGSVERNLTAEASIAIVRQSIARKSYSRPNDIVLVLDATETASYAFEPLVRLFLSEHGQWAAGLGFKAIWIVGPNAELTHRIDADRPE